MTNIYLQTIAKGIYDFEDSDKFLLENVASQCPYTGGTAVFKARSMLIRYPEYVFDDGQCDSQAQLFIGNGNIGNTDIESTTLKVFPNPAQKL